MLSDTTKPQPIGQSYMFGQQSRAQRVRFTSDPTDYSGAGITMPNNRQIYSAAFNVCTGLLIEDCDTGKTALFHFYPGIVTIQQLATLKEFQSNASHCKAVFIGGHESLDSTQQFTFAISDGANHYYEKNDSLSAIVNRELPGIQWETPIHIPCGHFSLAYDAATRHMHIQARGTIDQELTPYTDMEYGYYDYGDPFAITPAQTATPISTITANSDYKGQVESPAAHAAQTAVRYLSPQ
jgi:hypothetical protein